MSNVGRCSAFLALLLLTSFAITSSAARQNTGNKAGILSGVVADKAENAPIPYAFVYVHGSYKKALFDAAVPITAAGRFRVSLGPGVYDVFVAAAGFAPTCTSISIQAGKVTDFEPRLGPDFANLQD